MENDHLSLAILKIEDTKSELSKSLLYKIARDELNTKWKIPYKVIVIKEVNKQRVYDLLITIIQLLKTDRHIPIMMLERSIMELVSILFSFKDVLDNAIKSDDFTNLENEAMLLLVGYRFEIKGEDDDEIDLEENAKFKSKNVLGYIDKMDKHLTDYRKCYDALSEFVHPNFCGCTNSYSENDEKNFTTYFGFDPQKDINFYVSTLKYINVVVNQYINLLREMEKNIGELIILGKSKENNSK
jgi:hypothetical protein